MMPMLRKLFLLVCVFMMSLCIGSCSSQGFDEFVFRQDKGNQLSKSVYKKKFSARSLSRTELEHLLEMSLNTSPPEKYGDLIFRDRSTRNGMNPVVFSHQKHRVFYTCRVCHVELEFSMQKGESDITRADYLEGRFCGACHNGTIAFHVNFSCDSCHVKVDEKNTYQARGVSSGSLPHVAYGDGIDWVAAIAEGIIAPKNSLLSEDGGAQSMSLPEHLKSPMMWTTREPRTVVSFSHVKHTQWLDCANCHPDIFNIEQMGTVAFDKEKNLYGMFCGTCHMTVAFPMNGCSRCHPSLNDRL